MEQAPAGPGCRSGCPGSDARGTVDHRRVHGGAHCVLLLRSQAPDDLRGDVRARERARGHRPHLRVRETPHPGEPGGGGRSRRAGGPLAEHRRGGPHRVLPQDPQAEDHPARPDHGLLRDPQGVVRRDRHRGQPHRRRADESLPGHPDQRQARRQGHRLHHQLGDGQPAGTAEHHGSFRRPQRLSFHRPGHPGLAGRSRTSSSWRPVRPWARPPSP